MQCFLHGGSKRHRRALEAAALQVCACSGVGPLSHAHPRGAIFCTWNPPYPLGLITTHMPPAISAGHTLLFDSRMWTDSRGVRWLSESHNGNSRNFVRRRKPRVERGAACSMLLSIDWSTHVHVSVRSVRRARGSSVGHGQGATPPCYCVVVMLLRRCTRAKAHPTPFLSICFVMH